MLRRGVRALRDHDPGPVPAATPTATAYPTTSTSRSTTMTDVHNTYVAAGYRAHRSPTSTPTTTAATRSPTSTSPTSATTVSTATAPPTTTSRTNRPQDTWGYCVLDNDYRKGEFPTNTPKREPPGHRGPRVLPRRPVRLRHLRGRLGHGGHRDLGRGRALRQRQRQRAVPPQRADGAAARVARPVLPAASTTAPGSSSATSPSGSRPPTGRDADPGPRPVAPARRRRPAASASTRSRA